YAPHFLRSLGLSPFVAVVIGIGCVHLVDIATAAAARYNIAAPRQTRRAAAAACAAALLALGGASLHAYLERPLSDRYAAFSYATVSLAGAARLGPSGAVIVDQY